MFLFDGFTEKANKALNLAIAVASQLGHTYIGSEHILFGLVAEGSGVAATLLAKKNVTKEIVEEKLETTIGKGVPSHVTPADFTPRTKRILEMAIAESRRLGHFLCRNRAYFDGNAQGAGQLWRFVLCEEIERQSPTDLYTGMYRELTSADSKEGNAEFDSPQGRQSAAEIQEALCLNTGRDLTAAC